MLTPESIKTIEKSRPHGWVMEPDAKALMKSEGFDIPDFVLTRSFDPACRFMKGCKNGVVLKAVSKKIIHKTDHQAVVTGVSSQKHLKREMARLAELDGCENILIEEMIHGTEIMIGAKNDFQFGPVVVLGIGGTSVEIYNDTAIRMAPLKPQDVYAMVDVLRAKELITGHRGRQGVPMDTLAQMVTAFSRLAMALEQEMDSLDLNPVIFTREGYVIADARIILQPEK